MRQILTRIAFNLIKAKAMPTIKAYACKSCSSIASVIVRDNSITVNKCACVMVGI